MWLMLGPQTSNIGGSGGTSRVAAAIAISSDASSYVLGAPGVGGIYVGFYNATCGECPAGSYCPGPGFDAIPCPVGTYDDSFGPIMDVSDCSQCGQGQYADSPAQVGCQTCAIGTWSDAVGANSSSTCQPCSANPFLVAIQYEPEQDSEVHACMPGCNVPPAWPGLPGQCYQLNDGGQCTPACPISHTLDNQQVTCEGTTPTNATCDLATQCVGAYVPFLTIPPDSQSAFLPFSSNLGSQAQGQGSAVALSGDGRLLVVGAPSSGAFSQNQGGQLHSKARKGGRAGLWTPRYVIWLLCCC